MTARVQQADESVIQYAVAKQKLLSLAPVTLTDQQKVQALTEGLRSWQHQAAVMRANPAIIAAFYAACDNLPTSLSASAVVPAPAAAPAAAPPTAAPVDASAALADKLMIDLAARLERLIIGRTGGGGGGGGGYTPGPARAMESAGRGRGSGGSTTPPGGRYVPVSERKCFNCDVKGHLAKDCPSPKK